MAVILKVSYSNSLNGIVAWALAAKLISLNWYQFDIIKLIPIWSDCKYRSHSASTVLIQQVPFSVLYFDEQVPSLQIRITVLFSADLRTPRTALPGFPTTLPVFQNVSTHFFTPVHTQSMPRPRDATSIDENWTLTERRVRHLERTVLGRYLLSCHIVNDRRWNCVLPLFASPSLLWEARTHALEQCFFFMW